MAMTRIGVISDTHGLFRQAINKVFSSCDLIIHAGDIGNREVLRELGRIAPVQAVRGNADKGAWADRLPDRRAIRVAGERIVVVHQFDKTKPARAGIYVSGHSHQPEIEVRGDAWFINPGSAGPRRFNLPVTVAMLEINGSRRARIIGLNDGK